MSIALPRPKSLFGYDVVGPLGEGNAHPLYVVCHPETGQLHALKHTVRKTDKDAELIEQLQSEFEASKHFRSPFLRKCVDLKINKKLLGAPTEAALIMELVDGEALENVTLKPVDLINVFMQVARALAALHHLRFVHCQVKPHHILVSSDGSAKLIDFSHVCKIGGLQANSAGMSEFIAPEQARCKAVSELTDIYNFGATLYWALTRHRVPSLLTVKEADWESLKEQPYPSPRELNPEIPEPLSKLAMWCCRFSVGSRPPDMNMVIGGLETVSKAVEAAAPPAPVLLPTPKPEPRVAPRHRNRSTGGVVHPLSFGSDGD
jgi:serine/threonine protein kinase